MHTTLRVTLATVMLLVVATGAFAAALNPPPIGHGRAAVSHAPTAVDAIGKWVANANCTQTLTVCDQYAITYTLACTQSGTIKSISGSCVGASSCDNGGTWPVSGTYDISSHHLLLTVTNPIPCDFQFYVIDAVVTPGCFCADGTYDWNLDGADGSMNLASCGR